MAFLLSTVIILVLDQSSKRFFFFYEDLPWWLIPDHVGFDFAFNEGVAFSFPITGYFSIALSTVVVGLLLWYYKTSIRKNLLSGVIFGMIVGGALGNIIDRLRFGAVIDFIRIGWWPIFNLADSAIVIGFVLLIAFHQRLHRANGVHMGKKPE